MTTDTPERDDQTNIRRWIVNIDQASRMFGHHRDPDTEPEGPTEKIDDVTDEELRALEDEIPET